VTERGERVPGRGVDGQMRPEREEDRDERAYSERKRKRVSARPHEQREPEQRCRGRQPAEEDKALAAVALVARHEVERLRRIEGDLSERAPAGLERPGDDPVTDRDPGARGGERRPGLREYRPVPPRPAQR